MGAWLSEASLVAPSSAIGYVILALFALGALALVYTLRKQWRSLSIRSWFLVAIFSGLAFLIGSIDQVPIRSLTSAVIEYVPPEQAIPLTPLALALFILVGALINPAGAFLVALSFGVGRGLWATHQIYDFFIPVFVATFIAGIMYQRYAGRIYHWLRKPAIAGFLGAFLQVFLVVLAMWATGSVLLGGLLSFDRAMKTAFNQAPFLIANAIFASLLVWLILSLAPSTRKHNVVTRSPFSRSLNRKLASTYLMLIGLIGVLLLVMGYAIARQSAANSMKQKMQEQSELAAESIDHYLQSQREWLSWIGANSDLSALTDPAAESNSRLADSLVERFDGVFFVGNDVDGKTIVADLGSAASLSDVEIEAISFEVEQGDDKIIAVPGNDHGESYVDIVSPITEDGAVGTVIVGRIAATSLADAIPDSMRPPAGSDFTILDGDGEQILESTLNESTVEVGDTGSMTTAEESSSQDVVYSGEMPGYGWTLNMTVPEETLIQESLESLGRGALLFLGAVVISASVLFMVVRTISETLNQIADSTLQAARTRSDVTVTTNGHDEIDGLVRAVRRLQIMHRQRLEEQRLLLEVSDQVSRSFDLNEAMPVLLAGLKRGTYATGARVVIANVDDRPPLTFSTGPSKKSLAVLDRSIVRHLQQDAELILRTPQEVQEALGANGNSHVLPQSIAAVCLESRDLHSVLYVWRDSPHYWESNQLRLLRTLSGHASTLIENASLLAKVEGSRRRMAAILGSTADAVIATDDDGRVLLFNSAMEGYFGVQARQAIGRPIEKVINAPTLVNALQDEESPRGRLEISTKDGRILDCAFARFNGSTVLEAGKVAVLHDITHIKEIDALKSEFVSNVSHDLRSPLAYMTNYAALIPTQGDLQPKQREWLDRIVAGIEEMTSLIETLLDLQRLDAGVALAMTDFRIENLLRAVVEEFRQHAGEQGISIELHMGTDYPELIGDPDLIRQSIRNLLSNAIKYAPESGPVAVSVKVDGDDLLISVEDHGPGIPEYERTRVFEMFYRAPQARVANRKGKGLGLAFVKSTAERHGGRAWCDSQLGKGSTFSIALPIKKDPALEVPKYSG
jgi:PAS domain S-box-containing protein